MQEAIDAVRLEFQEAGFSLRPRIFPEEVAADDASAAEATSASEQSSPNPSNIYTPTETMYLKTSGAAKGVLQVHRAGSIIDMFLLYFSET